jgi:phage tail tape-measure protein
MAARGVLVGEAGPEILHGVPAGSRVTPAGRTRSLMGQGGGGGGTYNINVVLDGKVIAKATFDPWREEVRNRGGIGKVVPA